MIKRPVMTATVQPVGGRRPAGERGVAMLLALSAVAVAAIVGVGLLAGLPATTRAAEQLAVRDAAVYLAESALAEGMYRFEHPSDADPDWDGVRNRRIAGMGGAYDVSYETLEEGLVRIIGVGRLTTARGQTVEHELSMTVRVDSESEELRMQHIAVVGSDTVIPHGAQFHGDIHVNGTGLNFGAIHGRFSAERHALNFAHARSTDSHAGAASVPRVDVEAYRAYSYRGRSGAAMVVDPDDLAGEGERIEPDRTDNPLGVVYVDGDLDLQRDLEVRGGTLVVNGDLTLNGRNIRVTGSTSTFSVVVKGNVNFNWVNSSLRVHRGTTFVGGDVRNGLFNRGAHLVADEGLVVGGSLPGVFRGQFQVRYADLSRSRARPITFFAEAGSGARSVETVAYDGRPVD